MNVGTAQKSSKVSFISNQLPVQRADLEHRELLGCRQPFSKVSMLSPRNNKNYYNGIILMKTYYLFVLAS